MSISFRMARRKASPVIGIALVAGALGGCATEEGPAEGMQRVETEGLRVDVPDTWEESGPVSDVYTSSYQDGEAGMQLALAPEFGRFTAGSAVAQAIAILQVSGSTGFHRIDAIDSDDTQRRDHIAYTYTGDDDQTYEAVVWGVADDERHSALLQLSGRELDEDLIAAIDESIVINGEAKRDDADGS